MQLEEEERERREQERERREQERERRGRERQKKERRREYQEREERDREEEERNREESDEGASTKGEKRKKSKYDRKEKRMRQERVEEREERRVSPLVIRAASLGNLCHECQEPLTKMDIKAKNPFVDCEDHKVIYTAKIFAFQTTVSQCLYIFYFTDDNKLMHTELRPTQDNIWICHPLLNYRS